MRSQLQTSLSSARHQFGDLLGWMGPLTAAVLSLPSCTQDPVHRGLRTEIGAVVQDSGPDLGDRQVAVLRGVQHQAHLGSLRLTQRVRRRHPHSSLRCRRLGLASSVLGGSSEPNEQTGLLRADLLGEGFVVVRHQLVDDSSLSARFESNSKSACVFPHDVERHLRGLQLSFESSNLSLELGILDTPRLAPRAQGAAQSCQ